jgi:biotin carboxylase
VVLAARDKYLFRRALRAAGLPGPGFRLVDVRTDLTRTASTLRYPCVVKPRSLSASRGVIRADDPASFMEACARSGAILESITALACSDHCHTLLVEDYLAGPEVAVEGLLTNGRLQTLATLDKPAPMAGPFFEETALVAPSRLPQREQRAAAESVQRAAAALGLRHGPVHGELRLGAAGPVMLELAPRSIGGLCSRALRLEDGLSLETYILNNALGRVTPPPAPGLARGVMMIPIPRRGRLHGVGGLALSRTVPGIEDVILSLAVGDEVVPLPEGDRYLGFIFARADTPAAVEEALRDAHARITFDIR